MSAEFVANMEDVLDLYAEPYDPRPVVCFDETSTQLLAETRPALPPRPGLPLRQDYEYRREGTRNLFLACDETSTQLVGGDPARRICRPGRDVSAAASSGSPARRPLRMEARCSGHGAQRLPEPASTGGSTPGLHEPNFTGTPIAGHRCTRLSRLTPKHGSWLNMAEIEFSVLSRSCLKPAALVTERNAARATINWRFRAPAIQVPVRNPAARPSVSPRARLSGDTGSRSIPRRHRRIAGHTAASHR